MADAHEKQFHEKQVNQDRPESRKNHEKSSKRGHKPAHLCETRFGKLVFLRKSKITDVSYIDRTVKKQHGKKSTTILLVFCQQNLFC